MKHKKFIKLFSGLLCASMLLTGCNDSGTSSNSDEPIQMVVAADTSTNFTDYITFNYTNDYNNISSDGTDKIVINEKYGELEELNDNIYIFKNVDKDFMNNVVETYTIYNAEKGKVAFSVTNSYLDGDYSGNDEFGNKKHAPSEMEVNYDDEGGVHYIEVITNKYTRLDDEVIEENDLDESYSKTYQAEYYDLNGTLLTKTLLPIDVEVIGSVQMLIGEKIKIAFGKNVAVFDIEKDEAVEVYNGETETKLTMFNYETDKYNYYLPQSFFSSLYGSSSNDVKVYDKKDNLVFTYSGTLSEELSAYVLDNGNVLVQKMSYGSGDAYDFTISGYDERKYNLETVLIDVDNKKITEVETNYMFMAVIGRDYYETMSEEYDELDEGFTAKFINYGMAYEIVNKIIDVNYDNASMLFFDNALNIQCVAKGIIPEQIVHYGLDVERLKTGDYLVGIDSPVAEKAIVKADGTFRTYLPEGAKIFEDMIIIGNNIYDFDLNLIDTIEYGADNPEYQNITYEFKGNLGGKMVFECELNNLSYTNRKLVLVVDRIKNDNQNGVHFNPSYSSGNDGMMGSNGYYYKFETRYGTVSRLNNSYIIIEENDQYTLYNVSMNTVLRSDESIYVTNCKDKYVLETYRNGQPYIFEVKISNEGGAL